LQDREGIRGDDVGYDEHNAPGRTERQQSPQVLLAQGEHDLKDEMMIGPIVLSAVSNSWDIMHVETTRSRRGVPGSNAEPQEQTDTHQVETTPVGSRASSSPASVKE